MHTSRGQRVRTCMTSPHSGDCRTSFVPSTASIMPNGRPIASCDPGSQRSKNPACRTCSMPRACRIGSATPFCGPRTHTSAPHTGSCTFYGPCARRIASATPFVWPSCAHARRTRRGGVHVAGVAGRGGRGGRVTLIMTRRFARHQTWVVLHARQHACVRDQAVHAEPDPVDVHPVHRAVLRIIGVGNPGASGEPPAAQGTTLERRRGGGHGGREQPGPDACAPGASGSVAHEHQHGLCTHGPPRRVSSAPLSAVSTSL